VPKAIPDAAMKAMLRERDVALWSADHYQDHRSTTKNATKRDPVTVVLKVPELPDRDFHGSGDTLDLAVAAAFNFPYNRALLEREGGLRLALAKLEDAVADLTRPLSADRWKREVAAYRATRPDQVWDDLDDDVPF
jgi:hypothetical protein